jgi:hypothetical protein
MAISPVLLTNQVDAPLAFDALISIKLWGPFTAPGPWPPLKTLGHADPVDSTSIILGEITTAFWQV